MDLDADFEPADIVGVVEREIVLDAVEGLDWAAIGLEEANVAFEFADKAVRLVGVAAREVGFWFPDDEGLLFFVP